MNVSKNQLYDPLIPSVAQNAVLEVIDVSTQEPTEPISLEEVKAYAKIDYDDEDSLIEALITSARRQLEIFLGLSLVPKNLKVFLDNSAGEILLPYGPITGAITVTDSGNKVLSSGVETSGIDFKALVSPAEDKLTVEYSAGYEDAKMPKGIKTAIMAQTAYLFEHRGDEGDALDNVCPVAKSLCGGYRRVFNEFIL